MSKRRTAAERAFAALAAWCIDHRYLVLATFVLALAPFVSRLPALGIAASIESLYRAGNPAIEDYQRFRDTFGRDHHTAPVLVP